MKLRLRPLLVHAVVLGALAGCQVVPPATSPRPVPRPDLVRPAPSPESEAIAQHFARVEADLLSRGLLRTDATAPDAPFSRRAVVENFVRIALYDEYVARAGALVPRETPSRLRRWEQPIGLGLVFGETVPEAQRTKDRAEIDAYARRLSALTGLAIRRVEPEQANFHVLILNEDERRAIGPRLRAMVPGIDATAIRTIEGMPRSTFCLVLAFSRGESSVYSRAVAVIRGEHPDRLRRSCIHEELAQGLGLANDSPAARPSIFNDDEEFALLTPHDELLLRILYDRRLRPGMREAEARPIVETIATDLMGGES
ncbi:DUF2927 domain-containing protein [Rhodovulum steppense]|uniref:DUF2927 family protein n=1 Tax=Rhodovulum steppense TaxID=540251 RepID=A0A4R1YTM1_9RHOB|nr:DUF2927 domain-containing protein [Rhodovulum steppense]TCM84388.1 DUF2927 family protein [Rhodovulum steppense]